MLLESLNMPLKIYDTTNMHGHRPMSRLENIIEDVQFKEMCEHSTGKVEKL